LIFANGIENLKLYYMIGLPTELDDDLVAIRDLTLQMRERMLAHARSRGQVGRIIGSVNPLIPKPGTAYQWIPMEDPVIVDRKIKRLRTLTAGIDNVYFNIKSERHSYYQALLSLGDRRVAPVVEIAERNGQNWRAAVAEAGVDGDFYIFRNRASDAFLPWDIIDGGMKRALEYSRFRVVGIFNSGFFDYDSSWAFTRLSDTQNLEGLGDQITVLEFKVDDIYQAGKISGQLEQAAGKGFMATNWMEQNKALFRALRLERLVTFITIGLIVFVAALNILISLTMMVMEKTRDIAVLMSMGTRKSQVRRLFITQGLLIGVIGTAIGLVLGYALSWAGGHYHLLSLAPEVYSIDYVPFAPRAIDGALVALVAIGISLVATLYPSWSAARILPAEALRYE
jgi:hypothetical protein